MMRRLLLLLLLAGCGRADGGFKTSVVEEFDPAGKTVIKRTTTCEVQGNGSTIGKDVGFSGSACGSSIAVNSNQNAAFQQQLLQTNADMNANFGKVLDITAPLAKAVVLAPK